MKAVESLCQDMGTKAACDALGVSMATFYRWLGGKCEFDKSTTCARPHPGLPAPPLALSDTERQQVLEALHSEPFMDKAPYEVYATLLDQGIYHCSIRTMYRILA